MNKNFIELKKGDCIYILHKNDLGLVMLVKKFVIDYKPKVGGSKWFKTLVFTHKNDDGKKVEISINNPNNSSENIGLSDKRMYCASLDKVKEVAQKAIENVNSLLEISNALIKELD